MKIIWSNRASTYIAGYNPEAAYRVSERIAGDVGTLASMPLRGRLGRVPGTRELVFHPWPYIVVYMMESDQLRVLRVRHAARRWP